MKDKDLKLEKKLDPKGEKEPYKRNPNNRKHNKEGYVSKEPFKMKGRNDPAWYFKYPELAKLAARIAFNHRNGDVASFQYGSYLNVKNLDPLISYQYILTPGYSANGDSGINVTSYAAWKMLNRRFRGVSKYQQADFGIIQFGVLDFMSSLAEAERIYGVLNYFSLNNKQLPIKLLIAMGVDPYSFSDLADYRLRLNRLILNAKTLCLVKGYGLLDHALLLATNIFRDKDNARAQLYSFNKEGYWLYDPTVSTGSSLRFRRYSTDTRYASKDESGNTVYTHLRTQETILADLNYQLHALLTDDDVDNVCSDILAFYGNKEDAAEIVTLSLVPEDFVTVPVYSDSINRQVHNMTIICNHEPHDQPASLGATMIDDFCTAKPSTIDNTGDLMIFQQNNVIQFNILHFAGTAHNLNTGGMNFRTGTTSLAENAIIKPLIDTDILSPTEEDIMEMTRLTYTTTVQSTIKDGQTDTYWIDLNAFGSVVCIQCIAQVFGVAPMTYTVNSGSGVTYHHEIVQSDSLFTVISTAVPSLSVKEAIISKYDWAPIRYATGTAIRDIIADMDNFVAVDSVFMKQLHDIAIISEFKNPISDFLIKE